MEGGPSLSGDADDDESTITSWAVDMAAEKMIKGLSGRMVSGSEERWDGSVGSWSEARKRT